MLRAVSSFMEFCYLMRRSVLDDDNLDAIDHALAKFHQERTIFESEGVRPMASPFHISILLVTIASSLQNLGHQMDFAHLSLNPNVSRL
jgi:hypothetical protein